MAIDAALPGAGVEIVPNPSVSAGSTRCGLIRAMRLRWRSFCATMRSWRSISFRMRPAWTGRTRKLPKKVKVTRR
jgi:hypothetical protein